MQELFEPSALQEEKPYRIENQKRLKVSNHKLITLTHPHSNNHFAELMTCVERLWDATNENKSECEDTTNKDRLRCSLTINEALTETPELVNFIITLLENNYLYELELKQTYSIDSINKILTSCSQSHLQVIILSNKQEILDYQANLLLKSKNIVEGTLNGKQLSNDVADRCAEIQLYFLEDGLCMRNPRLRLLENAYFEIRVTILTGLTVHTQRTYVKFISEYSEYYKTAEIRLLTQQVDNLPSDTELTLESSFLDPE